jgi:hypothetical protein
MECIVGAFGTEAGRWLGGDAPQPKGLGPGSEAPSLRLEAKANTMADGCEVEAGKT